MADKPIKLSNTGRAMLTLAATREDRLVPPPTLPVAAARQVVRSLLNAGVIEEVEFSVEQQEFFWREGDDGTRLALRATELGLKEIRDATNSASADEPPNASAASGTPEPDNQAEQDTSRSGDTHDGTPAAAIADASPRKTLRCAAEGILTAWDAALSAGEAMPPALQDPISVLRNTLARRTPAPVDTPRQPRECTKQSKVLEMLRRPEGATVAQISEANGLGAAHGARLFRRPEEAPGHRRRARAYPPGWPGRCQG